MTNNESEPRNAELRINESDRDAIKSCRDKLFDRSVALGWVARVACQRMVEEETADNSGGVRL